MSDVFISHSSQDKELAIQIAAGLEAAGYQTWSSELDSIPGVSYLAQTGDAIDRCRACLVIISPRSVSSNQVTVEVVRAHEAGKPFVPVLYEMTHEEFRRRQPVWRQAFGATVSACVPVEGAASLVPRIVAGLKALGIVPNQGQVPAGLSIEGRALSGAGGWSDVGGLSIRLEAMFDHASYAPQDDPVSYFLLDLEVRRDAPATGPEVLADIILVLDVSGSMDSPDRYPLLRRAVEEFLVRLEADDRVGIVVFSRDAETILPLTPGAEARPATAEILHRMDGSKLLFGGATRLAPGLRLARAALGRSGRAGGVKRVYVLTDGELHDAPLCSEVLADFRPSRLEVHAYGFGTQFDPAGLKELLSDQLGGSVKPICNEHDIIGTFGHVADVNRRLVATDAVLVLEFDPEVTCGDAWTFRPQERYLGPIQCRRLVRELGGLEWGRTYSLLLEVRLPHEDRPATPVARASLNWFEGESPAQYRTTVSAPRQVPGSNEPTPANPRVSRALDILEALRCKAEGPGQLESLRARREQAVLERRDPELIAAIEKQIAILEGRLPADQLREKDQRYLDADSATNPVLLDRRR